MSLTVAEIKEEVRRVVALYRVSTEQQGTDEGIPIQENECRQFAKQKGWNIVKEITSKVSGYSTPLEDRTDLQEVRTLVKNKEVDTVLVYHSDRLGRRTELSVMLEGLSQVGVQVYSTKEGLLNGSEHVDGLLSYIRFWQSQGESKKTSMRVKDAMKSLNEQGYYTGGVLPYGYKLVDTGKKHNEKKSKTIKRIVPDEEESRIVKLIFDLALTKGYGGQKITKYLNEHGYKTRNGKEFRHNRISGMLRNPVYMGYKRYGTVKNLHNHKREYVSREEWNLQSYNKDLDIIGESAFMQIQKLLDARKVCCKEGNETKELVTTSSKYALASGLVVCHCGSRLMVNSQYKDQKRKDGSIHKSLNVAYRCPSSRNNPNHGKKNFGSVNIDRRIEKEVLRVMDNLKFPNIELPQSDEDFISTDKKDLENVCKQLTKKEKAYNNLEKELELFMIGESEFDKDTLSNLLNKVGKEVNSLKSRKAELELSISQNDLTVNDIMAFKDKYSNWRSIWEIATFEEKQQLLSTIIDKIVLHDTTVGATSRDIRIDIQFKLGIRELSQDNLSDTETNKDGNTWIKVVEPTETDKTLLKCYDTNTNKYKDTGLFILGNYKYLKFTVNAC